MSRSQVEIGERRQPDHVLRALPGRREHAVDEGGLLPRLLPGPVLLVGGPATTSSPLKGTATVTAFSVDGTNDDDFIDPVNWRPVVSPLGLTPDTTTIDDGGTGLTLDLDSGGETALGGVSPSDVPAYRPVLFGVAGHQGRTAQGDRLVVKTDALEGLPVRDVGETESMPFLGPRGLVIDYTMMTRDQDIPPRRDRRLRPGSRRHARGAARPAQQRRGHGRTELSQVRRLLDQDAYALSLNLYLVAALAAVALALAGLAVNLAVQMPDRRRTRRRCASSACAAGRSCVPSSSRSARCSGRPGWPGSWPGRRRSTSWCGP